MLPKVQAKNKLNAATKNTQLGITFGLGSSAAKNEKS